MATTEASVVDGHRWGVLAALGLVWSAGVLELGAQQPAPSARETPSAAQLIERLRQIQGELGAAERAPATAQEAPTSPPRLSADQVRQRLAQELGVEVLAVQPVTEGERPAYAVKVMNPPGNDNAAFLVITLLVDGDTGEILAQASPGAPGAHTGDGSGLEIRRRTFR